MRRVFAHAIRQRGAALLAAMLTVTLVASFAATALWQQWRAVEVEVAERDRMQSAWILIGAIDWSRLILREDGRAGGADHLAEPWAMSLQEARLSTFLAAEQGVVQVDDASTDTTEAFLSGEIIDLQSRLNFYNLVLSGIVQRPVEAQFQRLFARLGLPEQELQIIIEALRRNHTSSAPDSPLMPPSFAQLSWLGLTPATLAQLAPHTTLLPGPTLVNINTANTEVLMASIEGLDLAGAQRIVQMRENQHFASVADLKERMGTQIAVDSSLHTVASNYFEVRGRLRLDETVVDERSLVRRVRTEVTTLLRERGHFDPATSGGRVYVPGEALNNPRR